MEFPTGSVFLVSSAAMLIIISTYFKGLRGSPSSLWFLFLYKILEYSAYSAVNLTVVLWLSNDCGLGDISAGVFISAWSVILSLISMIVGPLVDTIGIRKTQILSVWLILFSRIICAFFTDPAVVFIFGFLPLGMGFAIVGPLVAVAIRRLTTTQTAPLAFGLFYVLINIGYAVGGVFFDWCREFFSTRDMSGTIVDENAGALIAGMHFSTYQIIFLASACITLVSLGISFYIRDVEEVRSKHDVPHPLKSPQAALIEMYHKMISVAYERYFWRYLGILTVMLFVQTIFFHFQYTFPRYALRVLGEGAKIGSIYSVLNPILIVFLVPIFATLTKRFSSYSVLFFGSTISALSCFAAMLPTSWGKSLTNSFLGELIFVKWLMLASSSDAMLINPPNPIYWPLIIMIVIFTFGEAMWSPRFMQFAAEMAPANKQSTYISLSVLPFFVAKFFVGPFSGWLVHTYVPLDPITNKALAYYPDQAMVWFWIGATGLLTPAGLLFFRESFSTGAVSGKEQTADLKLPTAGHYAIEG